MSLSLRNPQHLAIVLAVAALALGAAAWLVVVAPKRAESSDLAVQVATVQVDLTASRAELAAALSQGGGGAVADLNALTQAVPRDEALNRVLSELDRVAGQTGVVLKDVTPGPAVPGVSISVTPVAVSVEGRFAEVSSFLRRLHRTVGLDAGKIHATGRLYTIDSIDLGQGEGSFPNLRASLKLNVFSAGSVPAAAVPAS